MTIQIKETNPADYQQFTYRPVTRNWTVWNSKDQSIPLTLFKASMVAFAALAALVEYGINYIRYNLLGKTLPKTQINRELFSKAVQIYGSESETPFNKLVKEVEEFEKFQDMMRKYVRETDIGAYYENIGVDLSFLEQQNFIDSYKQAITVEVDFSKKTVVEDLIQIKKQVPLEKDEKAFSETREKIQVLKRQMKETLPLITKLVELDLKISNLDLFALQDELKEKVKKIVSSDEKLAEKMKNHPVIADMFLHEIVSEIHGEIKTIIIKSDLLERFEFAVDKPEKHTPGALAERFNKLAKAHDIDLIIENFLSDVERNKKNIMTKLDQFLPYERLPTNLLEEDFEVTVTLPEIFQENPTPNREKIELQIAKDLNRMQYSFNGAKVLKSDMADEAMRKTRAKLFVDEVLKGVSTDEEKARLKMLDQFHQAGLIGGNFYFLTPLINGQQGVSFLGDADKFDIALSKALDRAYPLSVSGDFRNGKKEIELKMTGIILDKNRTKAYKTVQFTVTYDFNKRTTIFNVKSSALPSY